MIHIWTHIVPEVLITLKNVNTTQGTFLLKTQGQYKTKAIFFIENTRAFFDSTSLKSIKGHLILKVV